MEHLAGKAVDKAARFLYSRRIKRWDTGAKPFYLREHLKRFEILCAFLARRDLRVVDLLNDTPPRPYYPILTKMAHPAILPEHGFGWSDGETLFLPVSVVDMKTPEGNEGLAKLLIFFLSAQIRYGSLDLVRRNRDILSSDGVLADIYWIIENKRLFYLIKDDFPAIMRDWELTCSHLLERRPDMKGLREAEQRVEGYFIESLKSTFSDLSARSSSPELSLETARDVKERWSDEGLSFKRYRGFVPFVAWGKALPQRIKDVLAPAKVKTLDDKDVEAQGEERPEKEDGSGERTRYMTTSEEIDEEACEQGLALNIYDKILSWADFVNVSRPFDDDPEDDNDKKAEEMEELTTADTTRSVGSTFNADLEKTRDKAEVSFSVACEGERSYVYPEWDYTKKSFREGFSRVTELEADSVDNDFVSSIVKDNRAVIKEVRRKFEMLTPEVKLTNRQFEGDNIDIDAVVEAFVDLKTGKRRADRLYTSSRKTERDLSVLFLVDLSMSTDMWVKDKRVIEHEKEALVVLCESMEGLRDRYAIYGFSGKTSKGCKFYHIKGFDEGYSEIIKERINGLIPYHYTRMGPALRHAGFILEKESSKAKLLFILSDGKPNDVDVYEGKYGVEDTRMAIKGLEKDGIIPFCLTVDSRSQGYLPAIFGKGNYAVLAGVEGLSRKLPEFYGKIISRL